MENFCNPQQHNIQYIAIKSIGLTNVVSWLTLVILRTKINPQEYKRPIIQYCTKEGGKFHEHFESPFSCPFLHHLHSCKVNVKWLQMLAFCYGSILYSHYRGVNDYAGCETVKNQV